MLQRTRSAVNNMYEDTGKSIEPVFVEDKYKSKKNLIKFPHTYIYSQQVKNHSEKVFNWIFSQAKGYHTLSKTVVTSGGAYANDADHIRLENDQKWQAAPDKIAKGYNSYRNIGKMHAKLANDVCSENDLRFVWNYFQFVDEHTYQRFVIDVKEAIISPANFMKYLPPELQPLRRVSQADVKSIEDEDDENMIVLRLEDGGAIVTLEEPSTSVTDRYKRLGWTRKQLFDSIAPALPFSDRAKSGDPRYSCVQVTPEDRYYDDIYATGREMTIPFCKDEWTNTTRYELIKTYLTEHPELVPEDSVKNGCYLGLCNDTFDVMSQRNFREYEAAGLVFIEHGGRFHCFARDTFSYDIVTKKDNEFAVWVENPGASVRNRPRDAPSDWVCPGQEVGMRLCQYSTYGLPLFEDGMDSMGHRGISDRNQPLFLIMLGGEKVYVKDPFEILDMRKHLPVYQTIRLDRDPVRVGNMAGSLGMSTQHGQLPKTPIYVLSSVTVEELKEGSAFQIGCERRREQLVAAENLSAMSDRAIVAGAAERLSATVQFYQLYMRRAFPNIDLLLLEVDTERLVRTLQPPVHPFGQNGGIGRVQELLEGKYSALDDLPPGNPNFM
jgi:hypothetical protein